MGTPEERSDLPVSRRLREYGDVLTGYASAYLEHLLTKQPRYETVNWERALRDLESRLGPAADVLNEPALAGIERDTRRLLKDIRQNDPFMRRWAADSVLARCCYLACRLLEPDAVVETGVAYGVSSAFILRALQENGRGTLHSVDLPPLRRGTEKFWRIAVPKELRGRWRVHRGSSRRVLRGLLGELGTVDLFVHDSLHTHRNMRREFAAVWPRLRDGGMILADDVERNGAFDELRQWHPTLWRVVRDREHHPLHGEAAPVMFGIVVK